MKRTILTLATLSLFLNQIIFAQIDVAGIWQWRMNGKNLKVSDIDPNSSNKNYNVFMVYENTGKMYMAYALATNELNESSLPGLVNKQQAFEGTYTIDGNNVNGDLSGNPANFVYQPTSNTMVNANPQAKVELIKVKGMGKPANNNTSDNTGNGDGVVYMGGGGNNVNAAGTFFGEEYYGGQKRQIMIAPDGSKYYLGPNGRKVYVEKNGQVKIKSDAVKKAEAEKAKAQRAQSQPAPKKATSNNSSKSYSAPRSSGGGRRGR